MPMVEYVRAPRFPETVRVGPIDYTVKLWDPKVAANAGALGLCDSLNCTILVRADMMPARMAEVLLHEVLHAAYSESGLATPGEDNSEERVVLGLTGQLMQVWRDNPAFVRYFEDVLRPEAPRKRK